MHRLEDPQLLRGAARYTDDIQLQGQLVMKVLRAPVAHADISPLDTSAAEAADGVHCVLTASTAEIAALKPMRCRASIEGTPFKEPDRPVLAGRQVKHIGEPIAAVIAESDAAAQNALEKISVGFDQLPAVVDVQQANDNCLWTDIPQNLAFEWEKGNAKETDKLFASADHILKATIAHPRMAITPIEPRSCIAQYNNDQFTLHTPSQGVISLQRALCGFMNIGTEQLRVVTNEVGGSFAVKIWPYAEQLLTLIAAKITNRPVKFTSTRSESLQSDIAGRGRVDHAELALDENGNFKAFRVNALADMGAYLNAVAPFVATSGAVRPFGQAYKFPGMHYRVKGIYTNTIPTDAYRGAGKPESACTLERMIDIAAARLNMDPFELRQRNLVTPADLPYDTPMSETYDAGNYPVLAESLFKKCDWQTLPQRKLESQLRGVKRGAAVGFYLHATGGSTDERSEVCAMPNGEILVRTGIQDNGQGHRTTLALVAAQALEVDISRVRVEQGDTEWLKKGGGTGGSNLMSVVATTVHRASFNMLTKAKSLAGSLLEVTPDSLTYADGMFSHSESDTTIDLTEIALRSAGSNSSIDSNSEDTPDCAGVAEFEGTHTTFPTGGCTVEVEVDPETGSVTIDRYTSIDDLGHIYNEATANGQLHGGIAQAAGEVLMEQLVHDNSGQLLSGSLMDYQIPRASDLPVYQTEFMKTDSPNTILGAKGVGELTAIGAPGPIHNAVINALSDYGITHLDKPLTPLKIWNAIQQAKQTPNRQTQ